MLVSLGGAGVIVWCWCHWVLLVSLCGAGVIVWCWGHCVVLVSLDCISQLQNMTVCEMQPPGFIGQLLAFDADTVTPFSTIYYSIIGGGMLLW